MYEENPDWGSPGWGKPKRAIFESRCPSCEETILRDEVIALLEGVFVHERCRDDGVALVRVAKVRKKPGFCEHCGLELPLTGVCGWC